MDSVFVITSNVPTWAVYISIAMGLLSCFLGYKLLRIWMALVGFVIGMMIGYLASYQYVSNMVIPIIVGFLLGVLIGFLAYRIYLVGVFFMAFLTTFGFLSQLLTYYLVTLLWLAIILGLAVIVALLALKFVKPIIIISSSLNGAVMVMMGLLKIFQAKAEYTMLLVAVLLAILGIMVQFFTNKNTKQQK